jgi:hypothetical protein
MWRELIGSVIICLEWRKTSKCHLPMHILTRVVFYTCTIDIRWCLSVLLFYCINSEEDLGIEILSHWPWRDEKNPLSTTLLYWYCLTIDIRWCLSVLLFYDLIYVSIARKIWA